MVRTLALILPLACSFALPLAAQDSQNTSVADAARRSREQKKASTKPATIITNDTLTLRQLRLPLPQPTRQLASSPPSPQKELPLLPAVTPPTRMRPPPPMKRKRRRRMWKI